MVNSFERLYWDGVSRLRAAGADAPEFACKCLLEHVFQRPSAALLCSGAPPDGACGPVLRACGKARVRIPAAVYCGRMGVSVPAHPRRGRGPDPRPDTETVALAAASFLEGRGPSARFLELGSGSGCISVALAKRTGCSGAAVDVSETAVRLTRENAARNGVDSQLCIRRADLFSFYRELPDGAFDLIVSNPPYLSAAELACADPSIRFEPREALDGGEDGLAFYRFIAAAYAPKLREGGGVCFEIGYSQADSVMNILRKTAISILAGKGLRRQRPRDYGDSRAAHGRA